MRTLRAALAASRTAFDPSEIMAWTKGAATVLATMAMVLAASFVAVAMGLA